MIQRIFRFAPVFALLAATTAFAATVVPGEDSSLLELFRPIYEAFAAHQYSLMGALLVVALVAIVKRYLGDKIAWLHSDAGGSAMALVGASAAAVAAGLVTPGAVITWSLLRTALFVGVTAAGGYAVIKNLLVDPVLRPLAARAPSWLQPIFALVFAIFDHGTPGAQATREAEKAGDDAVRTDPGGGVTSVIGPPVTLAVLA